MCSWLNKNLSFSMLYYFTVLLITVVLYFKILISKWDLHVFSLFSFLSYLHLCLNFDWFRPQKGFQSYK